MSTETNITQTPATARRYVRHQKVVPITLDLDGASFTSFTTTFGAGGAFVECERHTLSNSTIKVHLNLNGVMVPVTCRVVYNAEDGMGLQFLSTTPDNLERLRRYFADERLAICTPAEQA